MKKRTLALLLILISLISAEKQLIVHNSDGTTAAFPLTGVDSLTIAEYTPKIGPFSSTWWIKYRVTPTGDNYSEVSSGSTYPVVLYHYHASETLSGIQVKGTRGLGEFVSLKITYKTNSEVLFGGLDNEYNFYRGARLPETNGEQVVYVAYDDFSSSLNAANCEIFEFKFSDYDRTGTFRLIDFEVIQ